MLADILKALEFLMKALKGEGSVDWKRRKLARKLFKMYLGIEDVIENGNNLVIVLENSGGRYETTFAVLLAEEKALQEAADCFSDENIVNLLKVHLPRFGRLKAVLDDETFYVSFLMSLLTISEESEEEIPRKFGEYMMMDIRDIEVFFNVRKKIPDYFNDLPGAARNDLPGAARVDVYTTPEELQVVRGILNQIAQLGEELRLFLVEKFKIEDIL